MRTIQPANILTRAFSYTEQLALYNGMDNLSLFEINDALQSGLNPQMQDIYDFELPLQAALLEMEFNGCLVDQVKRQEMVLVYQAEETKYHNILHLFVEAIGYYTYYIAQAKIRYSQESGIAESLLPSNWDEWKAMHVSWRRDVKKSNPQALGFSKKP